MRYQWLFLNWNSSVILDEKRSNILLHYLGRHKDVTAILEPELHHGLGKNVQPLSKPCSMDVVMMIISPFYSPHLNNETHRSYFFNSSLSSPEQGDTLWCEENTA